MARNDRPLSPHIGVYRWQISNTLSILHRMTGVMLAFGAVALVGWLVSIVAGPAAYAAVNGFFASPVGALMLFDQIWKDRFRSVRRELVEGAIAKSRAGR